MKTPAHSHIPKTSLLREMRDVIACLRIARADFRLLTLAAVLSAVQLMLNLYVISLLFPLAEGLIENDFSLVVNVWGLKAVVQHLPTGLLTNRGLFCLLVAWLYVCVLLKASIYYVVGSMVRIQGERCAASVHALLLERTLSFGKAYFDQESPKRIRVRISKSAAWIERQLIAFHALFADTLRLMLYLAVMACISWRLTLSILIIVPPIAWLTLRLVARLRVAAHEHEQLKDARDVETESVIARVALVQAYGKKAWELGRFAEAGKKQFAAAGRALRLESMVSPFQEIGMTTAQLFMAWSLALIGSAASLKASDVFVFFYLALNVVPLFNALSRFRVRMASHANAMETLQSAMNDDDKYIVRGGARQLGEITGDIRFKNLHFSYGPNRQILNDLSLVIPKGKVTALVGMTGAGKTTIAHLLMRQYDCEPGTLLIDGIDIRDYDVRSIHRAFSLVEQEPLIVDDTLRTNLCYGLDTAPDAATLQRAIGMAQLADLVTALPEGLETILGDRGTQLSGGEKQRVAICRALLRDTPVVILDEATSALDPHTEAAIMHELMEATHDKTVLVISHRLSTVRFADSVLVIESGHTVQAGSFRELSKAKGAFARCFSLTATGGARPGYEDA